MRQAATPVKSGHYNGCGNRAERFGRLIGCMAGRGSKRAASDASRLTPDNVKTAPSISTGADAGQRWASKSLSGSNDGGGGVWPSASSATSPHTKGPRTALQNGWRRTENGYCEIWTMFGIRPPAAKPSFQLKEPKFP